MDSLAMTRKVWQEMSQPRTALSASDLPVLRVRFAPSDLPPGAIDGEDLGDFLDGMQLILKGMIHYEHLLNDEDFTQSNQQRLVVVGYQVGSVDILLIPQSLLGEVVAFGSLALTGGILVTSALKKYLDAFADGMGHVHGDAAGQATLEGAKKVVSNFQTLLHGVTNSRPPDGESPPKQLLDEVGAGLRKVTAVGAKPPYQQEGTVVSQEGNTATKVTLNAEVHSRIISLLEHQRDRTEAAHWSGFIESVDKRLNTFMLLLSNPPLFKRKARIRCYFPRNMEKDICNYFAKGDVVLIDGVSHERLGARGPQPRIFCEVTTIQASDTPTLFGAP